MGERVDPCSTPISVLKKGEMKSFHIYCVFMSIKYLEKKDKILESKPTLFRIKGRIWWFNKGKNCIISKARVLV